METTPKEIHPSMAASSGSGISMGNLDHHPHQGNGPLNVQLGAFRQFAKLNRTALRGPGYFVCGCLFHSDECGQVNVTQK